MRIAEQLVAYGIAPFVSICVAVTAAFSEAEAVVEKISIAYSRAIDPETGSPVYRIENPSGEADLTLGERKLLVKYIDREGTSREVPIFFDSAQLLDEAESAVPTAESNTFKEQYEKFGPSAARRYLQASISATAQADQAGSQKVLFFNSYRKVGFMKQNFVAGEVHLASGAQDLTLRAITTEVIKARHVVPSSSISGSRTIGFTATAYSTKHVCRELFSPAH